MIRYLPPALRGAFNALMLGCNTVLVFSLMIPAALLKLVFRSERWRPALDRWLNAVAARWVAHNNWGLALSTPRMQWQVTGLEGLRGKGWYLISCNHQTWTDILVLQKVFTGRIPFLKFFLKAELIWVPVIGLAWWALDFPFMKRGRGRQAREKDIQTTREACRKFRFIPTAVINFVEGTRFTEAKHRAQASPYRHLLKPKYGGVSMALAAMGDQFEALLDVTIAYPKGVPSFWDTLCGRANQVVIEVVQRPIPAELVGAQTDQDPQIRAKIAQWVDEQWQAKDDRLEALLRQG